MDGPGLPLMLVAVFAPVLAGLATLILPKGALGARTAIAILGAVVSIGALVSYINAYGVAQDASAVTGLPFVPSVHLFISFQPDGLGLFFGLLISGIGALIAIYARGYFGSDRDSLFRFYPMLGFFMTAMMGIVLSDNMLSMLLFWEMTSISSFLLIGWERDNPRAVRLAVQALITTAMGGLALLGGVILLAQVSGSWSLQGVIETLGASHGETPHRLLPWAFLLVFLGCATKSAQWPFHFWLPGAMAAPTPVSAYLHSATMVKAGVYLFARFFPGLHGFEYWMPALVFFGAVTMVLGAYLALRSVELKRIFAYTTVSQLGLLTCAYGLGAIEHHGELNLIWPTTQILNHALYKAPLFILAGAIIHVVGKKEAPQLRGLARSKPLLAWLTLLAAYALAGGPFTLSFTMKEAFLYQVYHAAEHDSTFWIVAGMAVVTAMFNVAIFVRFVLIFFGREASERETSEAAQAVEDAHGSGGEDHAHETGFWAMCLWLPAAILLIGQYLGGIAPHLLERVMAPFETHALYWSHLPSVLEAFGHPGPPLVMSLTAIVLGAALGVSPLWRRPVEDAHNRLFPWILRTLQRRGGWLYTHVLQTGSFHMYVYVVLTALIAGLVYVFAVHRDGFQMVELEMLWGPGAGFFLAATSLTILVCGSALVLPIVRSRMVRVLILGASGFSVTGMYLLYQAPDLALTQLMFEIISVILFLLVLRMLPEEPKRWHEIDRIGRATFGVLVGLAVGWITLQVGGYVDAHPDMPRVGDWLIQNAHHAPDGGRDGGGDNVVNVTLVDFRGYDTLGEVTVLAIAAMGVFALIVAVPASSASRNEDVCHLPREAYHVPEGPQPSLTSSLFRTAMRLILPLSLMFAAYMFFKGHNEPGGGFIAGLVMSVALAVYRMAEGQRALRRILPIKPGPLAALGLAIALATAVFPLLLGDPLLRSYQGEIPLPGGGSYHFASVLFFDLGVLFVVVAVSVGIINRLTEELE